MAGCLIPSTPRATKAARAIRLLIALVSLQLLIVAWSCGPAFGAVTPVIIEARLAGAGGPQNPLFSYLGPLTSSAKSTAAPLANWTGGSLTGTGCYYASQATPAKWGEWAFTPAEGRGGYYDVYLTWANNATSPVLQPIVTVHSADPDVVVSINQGAGGNQWHLVAPCLKYDAGVTKSVRLETNPDASDTGKRTYWDSVAFAPCIPTAPTPAAPADGATEVPSVGGGNELTWTPGEANYSFDVYLSTSQADVEAKDPGALAASDVPEPTFDLDGTSLAASTTYYWRVVAKNLDESVDGPVWSFTTSAFVVYADPGTWTNADTVMIYFDAGGSVPLLDHYEVALDDGPYTEGTSPYPLDVSGASDGTHTVHVKAINELDDEVIRDITIYLDKTGPEDFVPAVNPSTYTGAPFAILTFSTTDALSGLDRFEVALDEGAFATKTSPCMLDIGAAADGTHTAHIRAYDAAGNYTEKDATILVDKTPPNAFTPTVDPAGWTNADTVEVTFATTDDLSGVQHYEVGVDGANYTTQVSPYSLSTAGLSSGTHTVTVIAFDEAGNNRSGNATIQIDNTGPQINCTSPAATNSSPIAISYTLQDNESGVSGVALWYKKGETGEWTDTGMSSTTASGSFDFDGMTDDDTYYFGFVATDNLGNTTETNTGSGSCQTNYDHVGPSFTDIDADPPIAKVGKEVLILFSASEPLGANPTVTVEGNPAVFVGVDGLQYTYKYTVLASDPEGNAEIVISGEDLAGNFNSVSDLTKLLIDTTPPVNFTPQADPETWTDANSVLIMFLTTDAISGISHYEVALDAGPYSVGSSSPTYTLDVTEVGDGTHTVHVKAVDNAGNECIADVTIYLDKSAPVTFTPTANPASWTNENTVFIEFSTTDAGAGISHYEVALDDGAYSTQTSIYPLNVSGVSDGIHTVHVKAVDNLGKELIRDVSIYLDRTGPLPFTPVSDPPVWYSYDGAGNVTVTWATSDAHSGVHHYEVALDDGPYTAQSSPYVFSAVGFTPGTHTLHIKAFDAAGNTTTVDFEAEVSSDGTPPTVSLDFVDPLPGRDFDYVFWKNWMGVSSPVQNTYTIYWTASDEHSGIASVVVDYRASDSDPWIPLVSDTAQVGNVPFDVSNLPESSSYQFRIRAVDNNNNTATEIYDKFAVYDAAKLVPTAKVISPANGAYLRLGSTTKIRVQVTMPVFTDPRDPTKAYMDSNRDWWFAGHTLTATPQLQDYSRKSDGRPTALRKTLLSSMPRLAPQSIVNTNPSQVAQGLGYVIVNTWETDYTLQRGVVSASDAFQVEMKYSDIVSIGNVRQADKPNMPGQVLPTSKEEPLINTLKLYEFSRFWVK